MQTKHVPEKLHPLGSPVVPSLVLVTGVPGDSHRTLRYPFIVSPAATAAQCAPQLSFVAFGPGESSL